MFLPAPSPPKNGSSFLPGCVARVELGGHAAGVLSSALPSQLASFFGGVPSDFKVANFSASSSAVFFPNWVVRESAIARSPLCFDGASVHFSNWVEPGEVERGQLRQKAWVRLIGWPIRCWGAAEVRAAVSSFGELWEIDEATSELRDVSCFRVLVHCGDVASIPSSISLWIEDRRYRVSVVVDSWEAADPILLREVEDRRLGLLSREDQDRFSALLGSPRRQRGGGGILLPPKPRLYPWGRAMSPDWRLGGGALTVLASPRSRYPPPMRPRVFWQGGPISEQRLRKCLLLYRRRAAPLRYALSRRLLPFCLRPRASPACDRVLL